MNFLKDGLNLKRYELSVIESVLTTWTTEIAEDFTREELEKVRDAFYFGDIGSRTETGFKLLHKDEDTMNLIGKVLITLVDNKLKDEE